MNAAQHILIFLVRVYQWTLSPAKILLFGPLGRCRYTPSCSQYALEAIRIHKAMMGSWLSLKRICRCQPWGGCGHDPVLRGSACGSRAESGVAPDSRSTTDSRSSNIFSEQSEERGSRRDASNCTPEACAPHLKFKTHDSKFKTVFHGS